MMESALHTAHIVSGGMLYLHSVQSALRPHVEWDIAGVLRRDVELQWQRQPQQPGCWRSELHWEGAAGTGARLASTLRGWTDLRYEVTEDAGPGWDGARWMHTPELGVFHAQTDSAGDTVVTENQVRNALAQSGGSPVRLRREMRLILGDEWDERLEPFRRAADDSPAVWLHRVG